jgi:hypothetical protein
MTFLVQDDAVWMVGEHKPVRLTDGQCDALLDLFEDAGAADLFNRLYEAQRKAMGPLFIPRASAMRGLALVVDNGSKLSVRDMLSASVERISTDA